MWGRAHEGHTHSEFSAAVMYVPWDACHRTAKLTRLSAGWGTEFAAHWLLACHSDTSVLVCAKFMLANYYIELALLDAQLTTCIQIPYINFAGMPMLHSILRFSPLLSKINEQFYLNIQSTMFWSCSTHSNLWSCFNTVKTSKIKFVFFTKTSWSNCTWWVRVLAVS